MNTIGEFKGLHEGKRLFILASGPSLNTHDLSRLERRIVMGLNRSVIAYPDTHYHCVMDHRLFDEFGEELDKKTGGEWVVEGLDKILRSIDPNALVVVDAVRIQDQIDRIHHGYGQR